MATVTGKREVEVDGRRRSALPLAVLCDGDFVGSAEDCLCGLFKVVRNRKRLQVDRWETIQRLDSGDLAPSRSEARVCLTPTPSVCPSSRISIGRLYKLRNSLHNHDVALMRRHAGRWSGMRAETQKEAHDLRLSGSSFKSGRAMARTRTRSFNGGSGPGRRLFIFCCQCAMLGLGHWQKRGLRASLRMMVVWAL